jgi:hypothetical protein
MAHAWRSTLPTSAHLAQLVNLLVRRHCMAISFLQLTLTIAYMTIPVTSSFGYSASRPLPINEKSPVPPSFHGSITQEEQPSAFTCDDPSVFPQVMPNFPVLQPSRAMSIQPSTRSEGMVYPEFPTGQSYFSQPQQSSPITSHVMNPNVFGTPFETTPETAGRCNSGREVYNRTPDGTETFSQHHGLDIVLSNERPPPAKRGPFKTTEDRERTAQTRKIGSCIRCRMQRIRVSNLDKTWSLDRDA